MGCITPREFELRSGQKVLVRTAAPDDAALLIAHARAILEEGHFSVTMADEFGVTEDQEWDWIRQHSDDPGKIALVAEVSHTVVGLLFFESWRWSSTTSGSWNPRIGKERWAAAAAEPLRKIPGENVSDDQQR